MVTYSEHMVTNREATVKISKWLLEEIDDYVSDSKKNMSDFPSKRNFVDRAVISLLEKRGVTINKMGGYNE